MVNPMHTHTHTHTHTQLLMNPTHTHTHTYTHKNVCVCVYTQLVLNPIGRPVPASTARRALVRPRTRVNKKNSRPTKACIEA